MPSSRAFLVIASAPGPTHHQPSAIPVRHRKETDIHPYTPLVTAACLMVSVTVINAPWASAIGVAVAVVAAIVIRNKAATLTAVTIIIPACVSFSLMYG
ncbi:MAG: hypothetical protein E6534_09095, partial [Corynebacterium kroppenstedtii]|nr:hypothetical protein [Corynebacterium kroppenstedtii]